MIGAVLEEAELSESVTVKEGMVTLTPEVKESLFTVKLVNPEWRSGSALQQVFAFTAYPVSQSVRKFANNPALIFRMSWAVILFEILFQLAIFSETVLYVFLFIAAAFHLANACLFGLNRFFWIWPAAYPVLIWFQGRVV
mgnify:CR=1 FL=1